LGAIDGRRIGDLTPRVAQRQIILRNKFGNRSVRPTLCSDVVEGYTNNLLKILRKSLPDRTVTIHVLDDYL
jgi:hypothetical protein